MEENGENRENTPGRGTSKGESLRRKMAWQASGRPEGPGGTSSAGERDGGVKVQRPAGSCGPQKGVGLPFPVQHAATGDVFVSVNCTEVYQASRKVYESQAHNVMSFHKVNTPRR